MQTDETMSYPSLYVAIWKPLYGGNYQHWALYIDDAEEPLVIEVVGEHPNFEPSTSKFRAEDFPGRSFLMRHYLGAISKNDIPGICEIASTVAVDNETVQWDCQDYVLEILDALEEEYFLDRDEEEYRDAREILNEKRGPII